MSANSVVHENQGLALTQSRYSMSTRRVPTPTCIFVFMLLMSPGKVSGTETYHQDYHCSDGAAARQFCGRRKGKDARSTFGKTHCAICIPIPSMRPIHRALVTVRRRAGRGSPSPHISRAHLAPGTMLKRSWYRSQARRGRLARACVRGIAAVAHREQEGLHGIDGVRA
jgi:hypothetical protein